MKGTKKPIPEWKKFEQLIARIEADAGPLSLTVTSPDRIRSKITGRLREVDASVRTKIGTSNILITIECRKRKTTQDVTWIEQLATKRNHIGADRTIAVTSTDFSAEAKAIAHHHGIDLRRLSEVSVEAINELIRLDFVLFTHKRCALAGVGIRFFKSEGWTTPNLNQLDLYLPPYTNPKHKLFRNEESGAVWSINDLWLQLQDTADPFAEIIKGEKPKIRTACFAYPGNVTIETPDGIKRIGDVLLSVALALEIEQVNLNSAKKVEYSSTDGETIQRLEYASAASGMEDWRVSLQIPKNADDFSQVRTRYEKPKHKNYTD